MLTHACVPTITSRNDHAQSRKYYQNASMFALFKLSFLRNCKCKKSQKITGDIKHCEQQLWCKKISCRFLMSVSL